MMRLRKITFALVTLLALPTVASAGPIEFQLYPTSLSAESGNPVLGTTLYPLLAPGATYTVDPATGAPATVGVVGYDPARLPQPEPIHIHPDGTTHWNAEGLFRVDFRLTDAASGEWADLSMWGKAHLYNQYAAGQWSGDAAFWFGDLQHVTLGGTEYTLWGPGAEGKFTGDQPAVSVWVGPNPPAHLSPEPATLALAALGFVPFGLRRLRRA